MDVYGSVRSLLVGWVARGRANNARRVDGDQLRLIVSELDEMRRRLDRVELAVLSMERDHGATWDELGVALGMSRQAVRSRFGRLRRRLR